VAAAFNRDSQLLRSKVAKLLVFAGEAASTPAGRAHTKDYKVGLDPLAFAAIMRSGLPIFWIPREDGGVGALHPNNAGNSSTWTAAMPDLLAPIVGTGPPINFFVNGLAPTPSYLAAHILYSPSASDRTRLLDTVKVVTKDLEGGAVMAAVVDKTVTYDGSKPPALVPGLLDRPSSAVFGFADVDVSVSDTGAVTYGGGADSRKVKRFVRIGTETNYARAMSLMTGKMLERFALKP
jgi:hypothetical protein